METLILKDDQISTAAKLLADGKLVAFPTETVYGLGADATRPDIVKAVYAAKGRPSDNPLIVHVDGPDMVWQFADQSYKPQAEKLMRRFWPGPLTIIMPIQPGKLSKEVTGGLSTAAFRMPNNQVTLDLIKDFGKPIVGPSANTSGKPSPTEAKHVYHDLKGKISAILDDGPTQIGVESTVIDLSSEIPTILRPGMVTEEDLISILGKIKSDHHKVTQEEIPKAPGMKYKHYSPNATVVVIDSPRDFIPAIKKYSDITDSIGILATDEVLNSIPDKFLKYSLGQDVITASRHLFGGLRELDNSQAKYILAQGFPDNGPGLAYSNRLNKSAAQQHFTN